MSVFNSNITYRSSPKVGRSPRPDPYQLYLAQLHNQPVTINGMSGRIRFDGQRIAFVPSAAAVLAPAYMDVARQIGGDWDSLDITEDLAAVGQVAQCVGLDYLMVSLPMGVNAAAVASEIEQVLARHEWA